MNPYNFFVLSGFYSFAANIIIGLFVYIRAPRKAVNTLFFLFSFSIACWSVGSSLANVIENKETALWIMRGNYLFAVWLPALYVHFIYVLAGKRPMTIKYNYLVSALFSIFVFTDLFIKQLKVITTTNFYISDPGPVYYAFFIFFAISMLEVLFQTFNRVNFFVNKQQFQCIAIANCLAVFAGFEYFSRVFGFFKTPPFDDYVLIVYVLIVAFAMVKYDIFNLDAIAQSFHREKLATIGLLAASVNHEIRNPLYAAKTVLENYQGSLSDGVSKEKSQEVTSKALGQISRVLDVITKLNRFAKPIDETVSSQQSNIQEAIKTVLDLISYEFKIDKIKINNQIPDNLPQIRADQRQLEEILFNLIVNACHAMEGGGELVIAADGHCEAPFACHPESRRDEGSTLRASSDRRIPDPRSFASLRMTEKVKITIQDTGPGISSEQAKHLFEPFFTTKGDKGTGLGLYITKQLVERNGGKISVSSKPNQGTSFTLEFKLV